MKKSNVLFTALLCASVMFVGCSDDDDDNGNGGSGGVVKSKKVERVVRTVTNGSESRKDTTLYAYDVKGRLSKITDIEGRNQDEEDVTNITYANNKITLTDNYSTETIELKDGRAIKSVDNSSSGDYRYETTYSYSGKYISKVIWEYTETYNGETTTDTYETDFSVKDGNLVKWDDGADDFVDVEVGNVDNNMNIDLMYGDINDIGDYATLLCVMGDRFKKMPAKETWKDIDDEDGEEEVYNYNYEVNKDGYVTKVTVTSGSWSSVYGITYE